MKDQFRTWWLGHAVVPVALLLLAARPASAQKSLDEYAQPGLKDLTASLKVLSHNNKELAKIGKDYVDAYTLEHQQFFWKEPGQARIQGNRGLVHILRITSGGRQMFEVSGLAVLRNRHTEDVNKKPGKADTILDLGVFTPAWVQSVESRWVRAENRDGKTLQVFDFWYPADPGAKHTIWIDPVTKTVAEHVYHWRGKTNTIKKRFVFGDVKQVNGVELPTTVSIYNDEGKQAAAMRYETLKVNESLSDSLFKF